MESALKSLKNIWFISCLRKRTLKTAFDHDTYAYKTDTEIPIFGERYTPLQLTLLKKLLATKCFNYSCLPKYLRGRILKKIDPEFHGFLYVGRRGSPSLPKVPPRDDIIFDPTTRPPAPVSLNPETKSVTKKPKGSKGSQEEKKLFSFEDGNFEPVLVSSVSQPNKDVYDYDFFRR